MREKTQQNIDLIMNSYPENRKKSFRSINPIKIGRRFEQTFHKGDTQMANQHMRNQDLGASYTIATAISLFN